jgi:hypothetical protein
MKRLVDACGAPFTDCQEAVGDSLGKMGKEARLLFRHCAIFVQGTRTGQSTSACSGHETNEENMKKMLIAATAATLMIAPAAIAQSGANLSAPQVNSAGNGVTQPGTTSTGTAIDRPTSSTPHAAGSQTGNNASSLSGSNAATGTTGSNSSAEGRTSGGGGGAGGGAGGGN